jgi:hypothetical protein
VDLLRGKGKSKGITLGQANITTWNKRTSQFLLREMAEERVHFWCIQESHLWGQRYAREVGKLRRKFSVYASPATDVHTEEHGTQKTGGLIFLGKKDDVNVDTTSGIRVDPFAAAVLIRLKGITICVVNVYVLSNRPDIALLTMQRVRAYVDSLKVPYYIVGDWNQSPDDGAIHEYLHHHEYIHKSDTEATCSTGAVRTIDWMIASSAASAIITGSEPILTAPIAPHIPILHHISRRPRAVYIYGRLSSLNP